MASNNEDYDFFDDGQYNGSRRARREQQYSRGRGSGRRAIKLKVDSPASKLLRRIALITGLLAVWWLSYRRPMRLRPNPSAFW